MIVYVVTGTGTKYEPNVTDVIGVYTTREKAQMVYDKITDEYDDKDLCAVQLDDMEI